MKRFFKWIMCAAIGSIIIIAWPHQKAMAQPGMSVSFQMFYDELSPYGQWIDDPEYGYVWAPDVDNDFRPYYTNGRWVMTNYGNTWVSGYDWGWAPFHYGRWTYDQWYGWLWIPGDQWGPAWVDWRSGGGYYGWAPMGPGVSITLSVGNRFYAPYNWWTFIPCNYIYSPRWHTYWRGPQYNTTIFNQTTIINNYYNNRYVYGPQRRDIERHVGRVNVYQLRDNPNPGRAAIRRNEVAVYRPRVERNNRAGIREAPRQIVRAERPVGNRNVLRDETQNVGNNRIRENRSSAVIPESRRENSFDNRQTLQPQGRGAVDRRENIQHNRINENRQRIQEDHDRQRAEEGERMRTEALRAQREQQAHMQTERRRAERENNMRMQRETMQRQNEQRQRADRENVQRMQVERARQDQIRQQEMSNRYKMMERRQQQQLRQLERPQPQRQQREWRRPEPQMQQQRMERRQMERPQMQQRNEPPMQRERPGRSR